jgi:polyhydroxybutyrate depolymerase
MYARDRARILVVLLSLVAACSTQNGTGGDRPTGAAGHAGSGQAGTGLAGDGGGGAGTSSTGQSTGDAGTGAAGTSTAGGGGASSVGTSVDASGGDAASADGGSSSDALAAVLPSMGCGKAATQDPAKYVRHTVTNSTRVYDLWVPTGYDPMRAYRTVFIGHGCDGSIPYPFQDASKGDAILVALRSKDSQNSGQLYGGGCFDTMPVSSPEIPYFDQVLADVSANLCVDKARVFITGHSSGAWLSFLIGCARAGVVRGQANTAGALPPGAPTCTGPIAAMMMADMNDTLNAFSDSAKARDRILAANKCGTTTVPYDWDGDPKTPSVCVQYQGCLPGFPVVWCPTMGLGHSSQIPTSTVGVWRFWSQL